MTYIYSRTEIKISFFFYMLRKFLSYFLVYGKLRKQANQFLRILKDIWVLTAQSSSGEHANLMFLGTEVPWKIMVSWWDPVEQSAVDPAYFLRLGG